MRCTYYRRQINTRRSDGFTLIELMVSIAVLAVLLGIAAPGLSQFLVSNRLSSQINELVSDISQARNEAGGRGTAVSICIAATSTTCATSGTAWEAGRIIFVDPNRNGAIDTGEAIIKFSPALDGGTNLAAASFSSPRYITFRPFGGLTSTSGGTFTLCATGYTTGRQISVAATGRPLASKISTCP